MKVRLSAVLCLLSFAYLFFVTSKLTRVGDAGTIIYGAQRVAEGALPGRDFVEVMTPGSFYWLALFFKVLGNAWWVTRFQLALTGTVTVMLLYWLAERSVWVWFFALVIGIPFWPDNSHHWDSNLFAVAAVCCFSGFPWVSGALCAVTACFLQQKGIYLLAALLVCAALQRNWKRAAGMVGGFSAAGLAVPLYFWRTGALQGLFEANVLFPLAGYKTTNNVPYAYGWQALALEPSFRVFGPHWQALTFLSVGVVLVAVVIVVTLPVLAISARGPQLLLLAGLAIWLSEVHRRDIFHLVYGAPLLLAALGRRSNWLKWTAPSVALMAVLHLTIAAEASDGVQTRRGRVAGVTGAAALEFLCTKIPAREWVFIYPYNPLFYYLADVRNPTRYSILVYNYNTPAQFGEVIAKLEQQKVPWVLWNTEVYGNKLQTWFPAYRHPADDQLLLEKYFATHFTEVAHPGGFRVLQRIR